MRTCIYEGWVRHRRLVPRPHDFRYGLFLTYLDLDEIEQAFQVHPWVRAERTSYATYRRSDHFGPPDQRLSDSVRELVARELGWTPRGRIRLLTQLRYLGYVFNPVSFYYCFEDEQLVALVAEVHNTPWGERHCYVLAADQFASGSAHLTPKSFHVSPFMPMDMAYRWRLPAPGRCLTVHLANLRENRTAFDVTMRLRRRDWTRSNLTRSLLRFPWMTGKVTGAIYWEALRLWWKGIPFHSHPRHGVDHSDPLTTTKESSR